MKTNKNQKATFNQGHDANAACSNEAVMVSSPQSESRNLKGQPLSVTPDRISASTVIQRDDLDQPSYGANIRYTLRVTLTDGPTGREVASKTFPMSEKVSTLLTSSSYMSALGTLHKTASFQSCASVAQWLSTFTNPDTSGLKKAFRNINSIGDCLPVVMELHELSSKRFIVHYNVEEFDLSAFDEDSRKEMVELLRKLSNEGKILLDYSLPLGQNMNNLLKDKSLITSVLFSPLCRRMMGSGMFPNLDSLLSKTDKDDTRGVEENLDF